MLLHTFAFAASEPPAVKQLTERQKAIHILNRTSFGPRPGDVEQVMAVGIRSYIERQLSPETIDDRVAESKTAGLEVFSMTPAEIFAKYPLPAAVMRRVADKAKGESSEMADEKTRREQIRQFYQANGLLPAARINDQISANRLLRAVYSERSLQEVMVDFWQNHFNVFVGKNPVKWYIPDYERNVLRKHALGNFRDLVAATAQHPAMLAYLDNFRSSAPRKGRPQMPKPRAQRGLNENYARELMELHTLGVDGGYSQQDIIEVAKAFTGWTIADPRGYRQTAAAGNERDMPGPLRRMRPTPASGSFIFNENLHIKGPKKVLGRTIDEGGMNDGLKVIEMLAAHPSTAKNIARKLAVKFVSDTPDAAYVDRIAAAFRRSNGDIKETLRAVFYDKQFFAADNYRAKIKTPFELAASSLRALNADTNGSKALIARLAKLGEIPYGSQAPTGYPDMAEDWVNTGALLERINFAAELASGKIAGVRPLPSGKNAEPEAALNDAIKRILCDDISDQTRELLKKQLNAKGGEGKQADTPASPVTQSVSLVLGSPDFQRQ